LQDHGYTVVLANPAALEQYDGLKHTDDQSDGFFLAEMLRLNILPTGHICDRCGICCGGERAWCISAPA
jgi:transposase